MVTRHSKRRASKRLVNTWSHTNLDRSREEGEDGSDYEQNITNTLTGNGPIEKCTAAEEGSKSRGSLEIKGPWWHKWYQLSHGNSKRPSFPSMSPLSPE